MRTNLEKWNHYKGLLESLENEFINSNINKMDYDKAYRIENGVCEYQITNIHYNYELKDRCLTWYSGKKPTRNELKSLIGLVERIQNGALVFDSNKISFGCKRYTNPGSVSTGFRLEELIKSNSSWFICPIKADARLSEFDEKKKHNEWLLNNGHIRCAYCGKIVHEKKSVSHEIIFQNSKSDPYSRTGWRKFVDRKTNKYCSGKCAGNDQMAHEG